MHIEVVLFDLDGTLIDSYKDIGTHLNRTLRHFGREEIEIESVRHMVGGGARELLRRFFSNGSLEEALRVFRDYYMKEPVLHTKPYEGIVELLEYLKGKGMRLAVVTNKMEGLSRVILEKLGLLGYFHVVVGGDTYPEKKPSPLPLLQSLKRMQSNPEEAIMIGDTEADMKAGRLAGTKRGLALWGYVKLIEEVPDYSFKTPMEVKELI
ncbi:MAG: HAD-IA family hydrolase [Aquificaceae bacterium]|nr:HAD-IA family hydrolase [Aquificaceae bacterium]